MNPFENPTIRTMLQHSSVRDFTGEPVTEDERLAILEAAHSASSSCHLQITTVIRVTDPEKRRAFFKVTGDQPHVVSAPEFWVFCADYHRDLLVTGGGDMGWTEQLMVACTDTAIQAQSAMTALEALGLGGCFIGGLRTGIEEADRLLGLPEHVIPVLGIAFGRPAFRNELKPRLPLSVTVSENTYREPSEEELRAFADRLEEYYRTRTREKRQTTWKRELDRILARERRPFILSFLRKKGFAQK